MAPSLFEHGATPGDLIEIFREAYQHWAVYIGGDEVVHFTAPEGNSSSSGIISLVLNHGLDQVMRQNIWEVIHGDRFEINNLLDDKYEPRERDVIVKEACRMVGTERKYDVFSMNCEHFATEVRYGKPESRQVRDAVIGTVEAILDIGSAALGAIGLLGSFQKDIDKEEEEEEEAREKKHNKLRSA